MEPTKKPQPAANQNNQPPKPAPAQPMQAWTAGKPRPTAPRPNSNAPAAAGAPRPPRPAGNGGGRSAGARRNGQRRQQATGPSMLKAAVSTYDAVPVNKSTYNGSDGAQSTQVKAKPVMWKGPVLRVIPLGGLGEIGKNMMAIEYADDIIIIDIGFAFPEADQPGVDYIIPDTTYLERNKHKVKAIVITHGHMDHIGGAGYILPKFPVPIYGTRLSLAFVEKQISEFGIGAPDFRVMDPDKHERVQIGSFNIELIRVTHTIADSTAVAVRTPVGTIVNTGDWRNDPTPLDNRHMDFPRLKEIGDEGLLLLLSDSTNCDRAGHATSENVIEPTLDDLFGRAEGRIIISAFSSSITRVQMVINAAAKANRKLALIGRSTLTNVEICVRLGYLKIPAGLIVRVQDIAKSPDKNVVILSTGSQGEENSALVRMSTGDHPHIKIKPGDTIILSSSVIPGNEKAVVELVDNLMREGANIYSRATEELRHHGPIHVGGHGFKDDVGDLIKMMKPQYYIPIHGEFHHLVYSAEAAVENGVARDHVFLLDNGDVLELDGKTAAKGARVPSGDIMIDGTGVGDVEGVVLRDRLAMASDGIFVIVATVSRATGKLVTSPDIISRGFIYMKENEELVNKARGEVRQLFERRQKEQDWTKFKLKMRDEIGDFLYNATKRNPMVITVINEV